MQNVEQKEQKRFGMAGLLKGLWPGEVLLDAHVNDEPTRSFRWAWRCFSFALVVTQIAVLILLASTAYKEYGDTQPGNVPYGGRKVGDAVFARVGTGYCRDDSMQRPEGYFRSLSPVSFLLPEPQRKRMIARARELAAGRAAQNEELDCARTCAETEDCIGYAVDLDLCNIYVSGRAQAPPGWTPFSETEPRGSGSMRRTSVVVQANGARDAVCYRKHHSNGEPQDKTAFWVYVVHLVWVFVMTVAWLVQGGHVLARSKYSAAARSEGHGPA